jgi:hypothetical protein
VTVMALPRPSSRVERVEAGARLAHLRAAVGAKRPSDTRELVQRQGLELTTDDERTQVERRLASLKAAVEAKGRR